MKRILKGLTLCGLLALGLAPRAGLAAELTAPKPAEIAMVTAAMPKTAPAKPQRTHKVLVFTYCAPRGFVHDSIPIAAKAFEIMGQTTGAFETVQSADIAMFEPAKLNQFDAVIMDNTTGSNYFLAPDYAKLTPEKQKEAKERQAMLQKSLVDFVKGGKGLIGVHSATDSSYEWAEYGEMMGGFFDGHPWHSKIQIKNDEPDHILNKSFGGKGFDVVDEIYTFKTPYSREKLRVILSLDAKNPAFPKPNTGSPVKRTDNDFAVSWLHQYGAGRVFYCSLGHEHGIFWNPAVLAHYLAGIQYALGDLKADDTPKPLAK